MKDIPKLIWDNCKIIGEVRKSERTKIVVELVARDGVKYVNFRGWYLRQRDKEWMPGRDGFAIPIEIPIEGKNTIPATELLDLINRTIGEAEDFEIESIEGAVWTIPKKEVIK